MKTFYSFILAAILAFCGATQAHADDQHPWAGTYTLMKASEGLDYNDPDAKAYGFVFADTITITIEWCDSLYRITNFIGYDLKDMSNGGLPLTVEDDKYATAPTNRYMINVFEQLPDTTIIDEEEGDTIVYKNRRVGLILWGQDGTSDTPITFTKQSDGQVKINGFGLWLDKADGVAPVCYYDACVPLNGGDPEEVYDFSGWYRVKADWVMNMEDDVKWPDEFAMHIDADEWGAFLEQFVGYDVATPNFNAIYVDPSPKFGNEGQISIMVGFNTIAEINGKKYTLLDGYSADGPIKLAYDKKTDTVSVDYFNIYNSTDGADACYYLGSTATKITEEEGKALAASINTAITDEAAPAAIYNINGQRLNQLQKGVNIVGGKKIYVK